MAAKKAKGSSFSKSRTKAETAAYNTKNKVRVAKEALDKKKKEIKSTNKEIARNVKNYNQAKSNSLRESYGSNVQYYTFDKLPRQKAERGVLSQNVSDRSRSASRAAGIAKRVAAKGKKK
jgi:hypothetical protein